MQIQLEQWEERNIHKFLNQHEQWFEGMNEKDKLNATAFFFRQVKEYLALEHIIDNLHNFGYTASYKKSYAQENLKQLTQIFGGHDSKEEDDEVWFYYGRLMCSLYVEHDDINNMYIVKLSPKFDIAWYGTDEWVSLSINEILCSY
jgi:hypothetical protein